MILRELTKYDTILAFLVSLILYYIFNKDLLKSLLFSVLFVFIFLTLLNITKML